jgi:hypothetical protein
LDRLAGRRRTTGADALGWAAAVALPLAAYLGTLAPSITWRNGGTDSAEVAAGVAAFGLLHPPGYALYVALGHLALLALPALEPARVLSLLSALMAAAAAGLTFLTCRGFLARSTPAVGTGLARAAALAAALAVALGPLWWQQGNLATVHALNLLLAAPLCGAAVKLLDGALTRSEAVVSALLLGLATTHHLTLLAVPLAALLASLAAGARLGAAWSAVGRWRGAAAPLAALALGLLPWASLPLIAATAPRHVWGDPTTLAGWLDLVLARQYQEYLALASPAGLIRRVALAIWTIARDLGPVGFLSALAGLALLWDTRRPYLLFVAALTALEVAFFARYSARDVESYLLPICVALAPAAALGVAAAARSIAGPLGASAAGWAGALAGLSAAVALALNWPAMDLSGDREAIDFARAAMAEAPANALLLTETDRHTFALWYASTALGLRQDVAVVDRWLLRDPWYRAHVRQRYPDLRIPEGGAVSGPVLASGAVTDRPIVVTDPDASWNATIERGRLVHRLAARPADG